MPAKLLDAEHLRRLLDDKDKTGDLDLTDVTLDGVSLDIELLDALTDATLERTIEGASTVTLVVHDPDQQVGNSGLTIDETTVELDDLTFTLARQEKNDDELSLIFEDQQVNWLRRYDKPRKAARGKVTRAEFIYSLVNEVREGVIFVYCPELHVHQPIASSKAAQKAASDVKRAPDSINKLHWTAQGKASWFGGPHDPAAGGAPKWTGTYKVPGFARYDGSTGGGWFVMRAPNGKVAALQHIDEGPLPSTGREFDIAYNALHLFGYTEQNFPTDQGVWKGFYTGKGATGKRRAQQYADDPSAVDAGGGKTRDKTYEFTRGQGSTRETTWDCGLRLTGDENWRMFIVDGVLYLISEEQLMDTEPRYTLSEASEGVDRINYAMDSAVRPRTTKRKAGKPYAHDASVTCDSNMWAAPPGSVIELEDTGGATGLWLVSSVKRSLFKPSSEITLKQPAKKKPEPAPETVTSSGGAGGTASVDVAHLQGTPKEIIDKYVLPVGRKHGLKAANGGALTPSNVSAANDAHSQLTTSGNKSDHKGPPGQAWAVDMSNGYNTQQEAACAKEVSELFGLPGYQGDGQGAGMIREVSGYRIQLLFRTHIGGNHFTHVHVGLHRT